LRCTVNCPEENIFATTPVEPRANTGIPVDVHSFSLLELALTQLLKNFSPRVIFQKCLCVNVAKNALVNHALKGFSVGCLSVVIPFIHLGIDIN